MVAVHLSGILNSHNLMFLPPLLPPQVRFKSEDRQYWGILQFTL